MCGFTACRFDPAAPVFMAQGSCAIKNHGTIDVATTTGKLCTLPLRSTTEPAPY